MRDRKLILLSEEYNIKASIARLNKAIENALVQVDMIRAERLKLLLAFRELELSEIEELL